MGPGMETVSYQDFSEYSCNKLQWMTHLPWKLITFFMDQEAAKIDVPKNVFH